MEWKGASKVAKVPPKQRKQASRCWVFPLVLVLSSLSQKQEASKYLCPLPLGSFLLVTCRKKNSFCGVFHLRVAFGSGVGLFAF
jgi:hypothetical protein